MEYPSALKNAVELLAAEADPKLLKSISMAITEKYKNQSGKGSRLVAGDTEALVYAAVRMPATFAAVSAALEYACAVCGVEFRTMLDVGAGTGAAGWAADALINPDEMICLEREEAMLKLGRQLMQNGSDTLKNSVWKRCDLSSEGSFGHRAELVVASYMLNEMTPPARMATVKKLWDSAEKMLLIVEPGTPEGFSQLLEARRLLVSEGAHVAAPCAHEDECRLADDDWCHFTARVQRSRLHKYLKGGDAPYEDEKFSYMAFVREPVLHSGARILRHPLTGKGRVTLTLCTAEENRTQVITKSSPLFRSARKKNCGDLL